MKKFLLVVLSLFPVVGFSATIPYSPELEARLSPLPFVAKATMDIASNSDYGSSTVNSGAHGLGVYIPSGSIITRSWIDIQTAFTDSGSGTVAFSCEDANNILAAEDLTNDAVGVKMGSTPSGFINAACQITGPVAVADQATGKAVVYVEYIRR
jgi:hypothetical protein